MGDKILGIDLGTTNSLVGIVDSGFPILFADPEGARLTPSVVYCDEGVGILVGAEAKRMMARNPELAVSSVKRKMGDGAELILGNEKMSPEEISAHILIHLKGIAEKASGEAFHKAVITVPAYFNDAQRMATKKAGSLAGLEVVRILSEPTAAAISYGLDKLKEKSKIVVYDFGGGTFDVSVLELNDGVFQVLATSGDTRLGGDDLDYAIAEYFYRKAESSRLSGASIDVRQRFLESARLTKETLSFHQEYTVRIAFYQGTKSFEFKICRNEFNQIIKPIIERTVRHCKTALLDSGLGAEDVDSIVLVGGSTRIPLVQQIVEELFGKVPDLSQHPDEAVALGAVIQAGIMSGIMKEVILLDVTPLSLGIETFGGLMNVIIPRNTTIPIRRGEMFTNAVTSQESMTIKILQGEREMARDNWKLGEFEIEFEPVPKGKARVGIEFCLDVDGILTVLARDTVTEKDRVLEIRDSAVDVDDSSVEKMVNESIENAFEDMNERILSEARIKSNELIPAVTEGLTLLGHELEEQVKQAIENNLKNVEQAMRGNSSKELKDANEALDKSTEPLAVLLIEKALEK
ncbi:MAG TPA: molecular chaperone DnaK [Verrucomicrobia bacterium]|nr:molecular chaperone DnaK [Verrucomicrobiales bacterium]HIL56121.1 molecular chaperone DnaK [Verrucomicrobiota bacterium]